jgi:DNA ligase (NAD+)
MSREEAETAIRNRGGSPTSSVSSNTDYVVTGMNPGSSKLQQARQHGITQIDEDQFYALL